MKEGRKDGRKVKEGRTKRRKVVVVGHVKIGQDIRTEGRKDGRKEGRKEGREGRKDIKNGRTDGRKEGTGRDGTVRYGTGREGREGRKE